MLTNRIAANLQSVHDRIERAAARCGRDPATVELVAVTKYAQLDWVRALLDLGFRRLGENRPQQLVERATLLGAGPEWHLIGPLQRNKVRKVLPVVQVIHSLDSLRLLSDIQRISRELSTAPRLLLEVNLIEDVNKHGFSKDELLAAWPELAPSAGSQVQPAGPVIIGLMAMAAQADDAEQARPAFRALRELRDALRGADPNALPHLSMGMSHDFEVAIEEGATYIRVGSALWEGL